ncbi:MAG: Gfo/Idh/MocA family oxidoreductase [Clostridiales bacterium]|nr:Gfo/Idh/MocA family oxidoreductase [Clostridiales bacterium]
MKVGIVGTGAFAQNFIPLFKLHPFVEEVVLCDLDSDKLSQNMKKHGILKGSPSLDDLLQTDVDSIAIFTQNWMHGPQAEKALLAGKNVYSAVPTGISIEEVEKLIKAVIKSGKTYMIGETSYYYPQVIYCRQQFNAGKFGRIVYGEGEYYHDMDHGLYDVKKWRGGKNWKTIAGIPPMYYPTHSTSCILSVTGAYMTHVSCQGFIDNHEDGLFKKGVNKWNNEFSNESALFKMSDGSSTRINEFRRIGHPGTVRMSLYGTEGSFENNRHGAIWVTKEKGVHIKVDDLITCAPNPLKTELAGDKELMAKVQSEDGTHLGVAPIQNVKELPIEYQGERNGHRGSHHFLINDFVTCIENNRMPANNVWQAARYMVPGIIAHESAVQGGVLLEIPDFGTAPVKK